MKNLKQMLDEMDVPEKRKNDLEWLKRNLAIRNSNHPFFKDAMAIITLSLNTQILTNSLRMK